MFVVVILVLEWFGIGLGDGVWFDDSLKMVLLVDMVFGFGV